MIIKTGIERVETDGAKVLTELELTSSTIAILANEAEGLRFSLDSPEEAYSWLSCVYALQAVSRGNFGVGAVLVDSAGAITSVGRNEVFVPHFRSDAHAEMVVVNDFEKRFEGAIDLGGFTLYTSLESCPMCLSRLITAGVGTVLHVCDDEYGGMVHKRADLPSIWIELSSGREFRKARCSERIVDLARRIFLENVGTLNRRLLKRGSSDG